MVSLTIARRFAEKDCAICEGEGVLCEYDQEDEFCLCVKENRVETEADNRLAEVY